MPLLPLPIGESSLTGGDVPVNGPEDVLAEFPRPHRNPETAPVRDAFATAFAEGFKAYQNYASRAAGQSDPLQATDEYLKAYAEERDVHPGVGESEESVRARLFKAPEIVAPAIIVEGVNALLAPYTDKTCFLSELEVDGFFVNDGTAEWSAFVGASPDYPDRYYDDQPWLDPGGAIPSLGYSRSFILRVPDLTQNDTTFSYALDNDSGFFVADGSDTGGTESSGEFGLFVFEDPKQADDLYKAIVGYVETVKGQGIFWSLIVDPTI